MSEEACTFTDYVIECYSTTYIYIKCKECGHRVAILVDKYDNEAILLPHIVPVMQPLLYTPLTPFEKAMEKSLSPFISLNLVDNRIQTNKQ